MSSNAAEKLVCLATILLGGIFIHEASSLPPGTFDPLGSGSVPIATSYILIGLSLAILVRGFFGRADTDADAGSSQQAASKAPLRAAGFVALTLLYVLASNMKALHFVPMTTGFLLLTLLLLNGVSRRSVTIAVAVSVVVPVALYLCFTRVFTVDLPGAF